MKNILSFKPLLIFALSLPLVWWALGTYSVHALMIDRIVAIVNQDIITLSELQEAALLQHRQKGNASRSEQNPLDDEKLRQLLNDMINKKLQLQEARRKGIFVSDEELRSKIEDIKQKNGFPDDRALEQALAQESIPMDQYKEDLREQLTLFKLINREISSGIFLEEEELKTHYEEHQEDYRLPERIKLRQILLAPSETANEIEVEALAKEMAQRLRSGADFYKMAIEYSNGPESTKGGDLGWFSPGELMASLNEIAFSLPIGEISPPIRSPLGFHILQVQEKETQPYRSFESVQREIRETLTEKKTEALLQDWFKDLRVQSYVEIKF